MNQKTSDNQNKPVNVPFNGEPLREGEVLVPQFISREYAELIGAQGIHTRYICGIPYLVMDVAVPADQAELARKVFNANLNEYLDEKLGANRRARCMITMPDGRKAPCPRQADGRPNLCKDCPNRGKLEKENRNTISLEALNETEYHPMKASSSAEDCAMLGFLFNSLMDVLCSESPHYARIIELLLDGKSRKDIIRQLPVQKSQGYQIFRDCRKAVEDYLKD